jgi:hypothetical protein
MTETFYLLQVSEATEVKRLFGIDQEAGMDNALSLSEYLRIGIAVNQRMSELNAQAVGPQTPRWGGDDRQRGGQRP